MTVQRRSESLSAPYTVEFPFERTVGPTIGTFLGGLRDGALYGVRTSGGTVLCPAVEFDPQTAEETSEMVALGSEGAVMTWTWVPKRAADALPNDFAWALIRIDGTVNTFFHAVDVGGDIERMQTGMRVRIRWRDHRVGDITDIECFEPVA